MAESEPVRRWATWLVPALLLICAIAFGLRVHDLAGQSMWTDEGLSLYRARSSADVILSNTITVDGVETTDTNPPFYFLLLHWWRLLAGDTIFSLRFLGVVAGTLAIPLMYAIGRLAYSRTVGLLAALFLAVSPFHVWQIQVLRNYGLLVTLNLLAVYGLLRSFSAAGSAGRRARWLLLWLAASILGIYTHYFGFLFFAFTIVAFAGLLIARVGLRDLLRWRRVLVGIGAGILLLVPAFLLALNRFQAGQQIDFYPVSAGEVARQGAGAFSVGMSPNLEYAWWLMVPGLILFAVGAVVGWRRRPTATVVFLLYQFIPLGLLLALSTINPLFNGTRHLLIGLPPFLLLAAAGAGLWLTDSSAPFFRLGARAGLTLAALLLVVQGAWLHRQFNDPDFVRDDVRGAARYLTEVTRPDDVVVLHDTLIRFTFDTYYEGAAPVVAVPRYGFVEESEALEALQNAARQGRRVWFMTEPRPRTGFPRNLLSQWAEEHWQRFAGVNFPWMWLPVQVRGYLPEAAVASLPPEATPVAASFGDRLQLHGLTLPPVLRPGRPSDMTLYLSRSQRADGEYDLSLRFMSEDGQLWEQVDTRLRPQDAAHAWPLDSVVRHDMAAWLSPGLPPGSYQVWLRIADRETGQPLPLAAGVVDLRLPDVQVSADDCEVDQAHGSDYVWREHLFGSGLTLQAYSPPGQEYRPGHLLSLDLLWCVHDPPNQEYGLRLQLVDEEGSVIGESGGPMTRADYPATAWQPDQSLLSKAQITVPATAGSGEYGLRLSVIPANGGPALPVDAFLGGRSLALSEVNVAAWPLETTLPSIATPLRADYGAPTLIELHGYELSAEEVAPGQEAALTLYWRSVAEVIPDNYHVFIHLGREGQAPLAQADGPPMDGFRPTTSWRSGEVFLDEWSLSVPAGVPPGIYNLSVGLYDPESGERLPASVDDSRQPNDTVLLQQVVIEP